MTEAPIHRIELPNPFFEGRTNAYVIAGDPVTLIDTGIGTDDAFAALEAGLRSHGLAVGDIRRIVLTHHHMDHFGQAARLRELCGATVHIHEEDREEVTRYTEDLPDSVGRIRQLLKEAEAPAGDIATVTRLFLAGAVRLARSVPAEPLRDGERVPLGDGFLEVIHTPGHTVGCICLRYGRHLFSGDHVLLAISPNVGSDIAGTHLLRRYINSLHRVRGLQTDELLVLPGHGAPFGDLQGRVDWLIAHHDQREHEMLATLRAHGPLSIYALATRMFGKLDGFHIVLGACETWAHVEKLLAEGRARRAGNRFRAA